nr:hypothetical protein [uncultured organism]
MTVHDRRIVAVPAFLDNAAVAAALAKPVATRPTEGRRRWWASLKPKVAKRGLVMKRAGPCCRRVPVLQNGYKSVRVNFSWNVSLKGYESV